MGSWTSALELRLLDLGSWIKLLAGLKLLDLDFGLLDFGSTRFLLILGFRLIASWNMLLGSGSCTLALGLKAPGSRLDWTWAPRLRFLDLGSWI